MALRCVNFTHLTNIRPTLSLSLDVLTRETQTLFGPENQYYKSTHVYSKCSVFPDTLLQLGKSQIFMSIHTHLNRPTIPVRARTELDRETLSDEVFSVVFPVQEVKEIPL